jgi:hypothetical protein
MRGITPTFIFYIEHQNSKHMLSEYHLFFPLQFQFIYLHLPFDSSSVKNGGSCIYCERNWLAPSRTCGPRAQPYISAPHFSSRLSTSNPTILFFSNSSNTWIISRFHPPPTSIPLYIHAFLSAPISASVTHSTQCPSLPKAHPDWVPTPWKCRSFAARTHVCSLLPSLDPLRLRKKCVLCPRTNPTAAPISGHPSQSDRASSSE